MKTYIVGTHYKCFDKALLMSIHNTVTKLLWGGLRLIRGISSCRPLIQYLTVERLDCERAGDSFDVGDE